MTTTAPATSPAAASTSLRSLQVAMIGAGGMASHAHYPSLAALPGVEFAGICDIDPERMRLVGDQYGIVRRFSDYRHMIDAKRARQVAEPMLISSKTPQS